MALPVLEERVENVMHFLNTSIKNDSRQCIKEPASVTWKIRFHEITHLLSPSGITECE